MQPKTMLYLYHDYGITPNIAVNDFDEVVTCDITDVKLECINYYDLIWYEIPNDFEDRYENYIYILTALNIIEHSNPKNYVITMFKNDNLENRWFFYGMPYKDVKTRVYGTLYERELRGYNNITLFNRMLAIPYRYQRYRSSLKRRRVNENYKIPAMLILEILDNII